MRKNDNRLQLVEVEAPFANSQLASQRGMKPHAWNMTFHAESTGLLSARRWKSQSELLHRLVRVNDHHGRAARQRPSEPLSRWCTLLSRTNVGTSQQLVEIGP